MSEVNALEQQLSDAKQLVAEAEAAERLAKNKDFDALILKKFCVEECARYAQASADPSLGANERADALALAQASGHLKRFLHVIVQMGRAAGAQIDEIEEAIVEAQAEEDAAENGDFQDGGDV